MCKVCDAPHFEPLNPETIKYSDIEIAFCNDMLRARYFDSEKDKLVSQDIITVKFCPECGKKLELD
jgi:predicted Rdx family selenoprotein